jgi:hypothetical protein
VLIAYRDVTAIMEKSVKKTSMSCDSPDGWQCTLRKLNCSVILKGAGIMASYEQNRLEVEVQVLVGVSFFSSPNHPYWLWGSPSLLSWGYQGLFPMGKATEAWSWPLTSIKCWSQE